MSNIQLIIGRVDSFLQGKNIVEDVKFLEKVISRVLTEVEPIENNQNITAQQILSLKFLKIVSGTRRFILFINSPFFYQYFQKIYQILTSKRLKVLFTLGVQILTKCLASCQQNEINYFFQLFEQSKDEQRTISEIIIKSVLISPANLSTQERSIKLEIINQIISYSVKSNYKINYLTQLLLNSMEISNISEIVRKSADEELILKCYYKLIDLSLENDNFKNMNQYVEELSINLSSEFAFYCCEELIQILQVTKETKQQKLLFSVVDVIKNRLDFSPTHIKFQEVFNFDK